MQTTHFGGIAITHLGHSSVMLEQAGFLIHIDPFVLPREQRKPNLVLHTHKHFDHCANYEKHEKMGVPIVGCGCEHPCRSIKPGEKLVAGPGVIIEAVRAYNIGKPYHTIDNACGFIVSFGKTRIYHAGDTDRIPEMKGYKCDVALLPIGGKYTMNIEEAVQAALDIKPKVVIPIHYNYLDETKADAKIFKEAVERQSAGAIEVRILF